MTLTGQFEPQSWLVIAGYMLLTTWIGARLAGRQATIRDFFLGGRKLPWYAVSGSIIATELSAMTLVGVPVFLWAETGNMTYAILGVGSILARVVVGFWFVPRFYEEEIYSCYEYIGNRLGEPARRTTSYLFMLGGILGQGTRVLLTALVLNVVTGLGIHASIWIVGAVAVLWTFIGGIRTVIWTDLIQFGVFTLSALLTLVIVLVEFESPTGEDGLGTIVGMAWEAGKLRMIDLSLDPRLNYTLLAGLIASTIGGLASYGTDQMMAQRMFCCEGPREARKAIIWSSVSQLLMMACLMVGVGLWAFYQKSGLEGVPTPAESALIEENRNNLLPAFIRFRVHWFLGGIVVAGIFAAAISSLNSILAALAQQTIETLSRLRGQATGEDKLAQAAAVRQSRQLILLWGIVLCAMASLFYEVSVGRNQLLIELALAVVGLAWGGILGAFLTALIPRLRRDAEGIEYAAALSVLTVFAISRYELWALIFFGVIGLVMLVSAPLLLKRKIAATITIAAYLVVQGLVLWTRYQQNRGDGPFELALGWPWYIPLGTAAMLLAVQLICPRRPQPALYTGVA